MALSAGGIKKMTLINTALFPREVLFTDIYKKRSKILYILWAEFQTNKKALVLLGRVLPTHQES